MRRYSASIAEHAASVSLAEVGTGESARVASIAAGHGLCGRLCAMGIVSGVYIEVLQNVRRGPIIIALDGCRVVLGRGMAEKILVE